MMNTTPCATLFFPGAGSFGSEFRPLLNELGSRGSLAKYPGRFGREFGTPAGSFEEIVRRCSEQASARDSGRLVLLGHSFGAYVAYATALVLAEQGAEPAALIVLGAAAPSAHTVPEVAGDTLKDTAAYLDWVDPTVLADLPSPEWREIVVETTKQDLCLLTQFKTADYGTLQCPVFAVRGNRDPLTTDTSIAKWEEVTDGACARHVLPGGHSDFIRSPAFAAWFRTTPGVLGNGSSLG